MRIFVKKRLACHPEQAFFAQRRTWASRVAVIMMLTAISPWAVAQRMSGFAPHPGVPAVPGFMGTGFAGNGFGRPAFAHSNRGFPGGFAVPFFTDALYSDLLSTGYPAASQPPVIMMQAPTGPPAATSFPAPEPALMIELQEGRYVQVSGETKSSAQMQTINRDALTSVSKPASGVLVPASQKETMLATLVYSDGHREDISDYTIANGAIYAKADYYKSGAWNRRIELSSLNLPETIQLNQSRGLNFQLPSAPNEVIVGP